MQRNSFYKKPNYYYRIDELLRLRLDAHCSQDGEASADTQSYCGGKPLRKCPLEGQEIRWIVGRQNTLKQLSRNHQQPVGCTPKKSFSIRGRREILVFSIVSRSDLGPTQTPIQWVKFSEGAESRARSTPFILTCAEAKNSWSCTSTPSEVFMEWCSFKHRDKFKSSSFVGQAVMKEGGWNWY